MAVQMTASQFDLPADDLRSIVADEARFRDWYEETVPRVYGYLFARCGGDAAVAEELTQQTFVEGLRGVARFAGRADPATWLIAIARRKLVDHFRRGYRERRRDLRLIERGAPDHAATWRASSTLADVREAIDSLPGEQRIALVLHIVDGLPVRDVAAAIGRSEDATESLIRRARAAFRRAYGEEADV